MNNYLIFFGHYKTNTKASSKAEALEQAKKLWNPKKSQMTKIGAWRLISEGGAYDAVCQA